MACACVLRPWARPGASEVSYPRSTIPAACALRPRSPSSATRRRPPRAPAALTSCRPRSRHGLAKVEKDGRMGSLSAMAGTRVGDRWARAGGDGSAGRGRARPSLIDAARAGAGPRRRRRKRVADGDELGRSLNLAAVYKPAGGGPGHCGRRPAPLPGPSRAAGRAPRQRPAPARLPGDGVNTRRTTAAGAQGSPGHPVGSRLRADGEDLERGWHPGTWDSDWAPWPPGIPDGWGEWAPHPQVPEPLVGGTMVPCSPRRVSRPPRGVRCPGPATSGWSFPETLMDGETGVPRIMMDGETHPSFPGGPPRLAHCDACSSPSKTPA